MNISDFKQPIYHDPFDQYIYQCWREGKKVRDIVSGWDKDISEKDVLDKFKFIVERYFKEMSSGN